MIANRSQRTSIAPVRAPIAFLPGEIERVLKRGVAERAEQIGEVTTLLGVIGSIVLGVSLPEHEGRGLRCRHRLDDWSDKLGSRARSDPLDQRAQLVADLGERVVGNRDP